MSEKEIENLKLWFDKYEKLNLKFESSNNKFNNCQQVSALVFLTTKLKDEKERYFLHGEHDTLYIGSDFDTFKPFTEEEVKIAVEHGIYICEDEGFQIYASM